MDPMFEDFEKTLDRRKASLGFAGTDDVLPNSGANRTPEKREFLRAIGAAAGEREAKPPFEDNP